MQWSKHCFVGTYDNELNALQAIKMTEKIVKLAFKILFCFIVIAIINQMNRFWNSRLIWVIILFNNLDKCNCFKAQRFETSIISWDSKCLYSNSMISSNFWYMKDIPNIDGSYKQNIFQRIVVKSQYFTDMSKIKHALKKFKYIFRT